MGTAPFWHVAVDQMVATTTELNAEEFGAHVRLMIKQWQNDGRPLPDNDHKLARICGLTLRRWKQVVRPAIEEYYDVRGGTWSHKKVAKQFEEVAEKIRKNRENAARGGRAKARKAKERALANAINPPTDSPDLAKHQNSGNSLPKDESEGRRNIPSLKEERDIPSSAPGNSDEHELDTPSDGNIACGLHESKDSKSSTIDANDGAAFALFDSPRPSDQERAAWNRALLTLRARTEGVDYKHFQSLELVAVEGNIVTFSAPNKLTCDRASELGGRIRDGLQDAGLPIGVVRIELADRFGGG